MPRRRLKIYSSRKHLIATLLFILLPFLFLLVVARLAATTSRELITDIAISTLRLTIAYFAAALLGWLLAVSFYRGKRAEIVLPLLDVLQSFPTYAILPLATYFWGPTNTTVIFFLIITIIWPIVFSIINSLRLIRRDWEEAVTIAGLKGLAYLRYFLWPASITGLVTGSIIGLGNGWEAIIATEIIVGIKSGIGSFFQSFAHNTLITAFGVLGFLLVIFSINKIIWLPLMERVHRKMEE